MRTFVVKRKGVEAGPYSLEQIKDLIAAGDLAPSDLALWSSKNGFWFPVGLMPGMPRKLDGPLKLSLIISMVWLAGICLILASVVVSCILGR
jgi:hypothetical protein